MQGRSLHRHASTARRRVQWGDANTGPQYGTYMRESTTQVFRQRSRTVVHGRSGVLLELSLALLQCLSLYHGAPHTRFQVIAEVQRDTVS
jgi:hypothetical protein